MAGNDHRSNGLRYGINPVYGTGRGTIALRAMDSAF
jgi:hypothetical protein